MTQVNRLATVVVPFHFLSYNRWLSWSGADGVTIAKVELTPESYAVDCALPVPVTKIYQTTVTPNRPCLSCSTATTVSATSTTDTHTTDCVHPVSQLPQSLTPQTASVLCNSYHSHSHHRLCPSCATATTVTHTTDCVRPVPQLPQSLRPQTVSVLCHSYHSHSHNRPRPSCATATSHSHHRPHPSCATATTVIHTTQSHNRLRPSFSMVKTMTHHTVTATPQTMSILSIQPQSSFYHTATPQTMSILSTATVIILSHCYTTDHVHPLYSHSHHSITLLYHRPCPSSLQPQPSFCHTATPQTIPKSQQAHQTAPSQTMSILLSHSQ